MIIEFENCSLEIGYIGTRWEIAFQEVINKNTEIGKKLMAVFNRTATSFLDAIKELSHRFQNATYGILEYTKNMTFLRVV